MIDIRPCGMEHLEEVLSVESSVLSALERPDQLRRNTPEMWATCIQPPHCCLGAWVGDRLVAVAVLYVPPEGDSEALAPLLQGVDTKGMRTANYKICMVHPLWRGHGLQVALGERLHDEARRQGIGLLCSTVSPHNTASIRSLQRLGYQSNRTLTKYGYERLLFFCFN